MSFLLRRACHTLKPWVCSKGLHTSCPALSNLLIDSGRYPFLHELGLTSDNDGVNGSFTGGSGEASMSYLMPDGKCMF